jgi:hypothetical protein
MNKKPTLKDVQQGRRDMRELSALYFAIRLGVIKPTASTTHADLIRMIRDPSNLDKLHAAKLTKQANPHV